MSTYYGEGIQSTPVQLLPQIAGTDLAQIWNRSYVPSADVYVYVSPICPNGLVEQALEYAVTPVHVLMQNDNLHDNSGSQAQIMSAGDHICKVSRSTEQACTMYNFRDIILAEALHIGLEHTDPDLPLFPGLTVSAPEQFAAVVPRQYGDCVARITGVMELVEGFPVMHWGNDLPGEAMRKRVYDAALEAVKIDPAQIELDDEWSANSVVQRSISDRTPLRLSKLDARANCNLLPEEC